MSNSKWLVLFLSVAAVVLLCGCSQYKKKIDWAVYERPLVVAVEVDDYDGDKIKAGFYNVDVAHCVDGKVPMVYDIYILDHEPQNKYEITRYDPVYTVGGYGFEPGAFQAEKGTYICIYPYRNINNPTGIFEMEFVK